MEGDITFAGEPFVLQLSGIREDARLGRRFIAEVLPPLGWDERTDDVALLVTELLANVALHARTAARLVVRANSKTLEVEVIDGSPVPPQRRHFSAQAATGRGLRMVDHLADAWGYRPTSQGKSVWFRMHRRKIRPTESPSSRSEPTRPALPSDVVDIDAFLEQFAESDDDNPALMMMTGQQSVAWN